MINKTLSLSLYRVNSCGLGFSTPHSRDFDFFLYSTAIFLLRQSSFYSSCHQGNPFSAASGGHIRLDQPLRVPPRRFSNPGRASSPPCSSSLAQFREDTKQRRPCANCSGQKSLIPSRKTPFPARDTTTIRSTFRRRRSSRLSALKVEKFSSQGITFFCWPFFFLSKSRKKTHFTPFRPESD